MLPRAQLRKSLSLTIRISLRFILLQKKRETKMTTFLRIFLYLRIKLLFVSQQTDFAKRNTPAFTIFHRQTSRMSANIFSCARSFRDEKSARIIDETNI